MLVHEGDLSLTERQLRVSIVGSRDASDSARADAQVASPASLPHAGPSSSRGLPQASTPPPTRARSRRGVRRARSGAPSPSWDAALAALAARQRAPCAPHRRIRPAHLARPQVNGLSFTDEERAESLRARNRAIAALGLWKSGDGGKEGSSTLREVAFSLELGHPVLLWHSIVEEGRAWAIRLLENPLLDSQGTPASFRRFRPPRTWRRRCRPGAPSGGFDGRTRREEDGASPEVPESGRGKIHLL